MIQVKSDGPNLDGAQVTVHGNVKEISFEIAALAAQLVRHNYSKNIMMESFAFGMAHSNLFKED